MSYEWIIIGQLKECSTPGQKEKEEFALKWGDSIDQDV
jgi:hypothetical protein